MDIQQQKSFLEQLAKGIASLFGQNCEIAVHDLSQGFESSIIAIENGHVTDRRVGDGASELVLQALKPDAGNVEDHFNYLARTKNGRIIKCSSIYLRSEDGRPVGLFGINYDITDLMMASTAIGAILNVEENGDAMSITTNVNDLLDQLIEESSKYVGKPVAMMNKEDKIRAIKFLDEKGAFLVKKAGDKVSRYYDISKYTLYNYMDADTQ